MSKIFILNPYSKIGGGQVSQIGLKKSIEQTKLFDEIIQLNVFNRLDRLKHILKIIFQLNFTSSDYLILQGIFEIEYILFDILLVKKNKLIIIPRGAYVPMSNTTKIINKPFFKRLLWKLFIKKRINSSALWITTSSLEQERLVHVGAKKNNSIVIPDYFNGNERFNYDVDISNQLKYNQENFILYVGRISIEKNLIFLIDVFSKIETLIDNYKYIIIGPVDDQQYYRILKRKIRELKLEEKIIIELNVSQNKLIEYYKNSKLILLPSFIESLGLIVLESIYFKKYIIISDNVPFNLNNTTLGETLKLDETIWAQRISSYILNNNHNIDLNKREEILDNYSLANIVSLWRNNLSKLLNI